MPGHLPAGVPENTEQLLSLSITYDRAESSVFCSPCPHGLCIYSACLEGMRCVSTGSVESLGPWGRNYGTCDTAGCLLPPKALNGSPSLLYYMHQSQMGASVHHSGPALEPCGCRVECAMQENLHLLCPTMSLSLQALCAVDPAQPLPRPSGFLSRWLCFFLTLLSKSLEPFYS